MHTNIESLPHNIGNLIHLRYLNVSWSRVTELPESVCNLTNLQFLILKGCRQLTQIPLGVGRLVNLWTLDCRGTQLESLPYGIGRLKYLNDLRGFVVNTTTGTCPACMEAEPRSVLKGNQKLKHLRLNCSSRSTSDGYREEEIEKMEKVLDVALHPPSSLVTLRLQNLYLLRYPSWMASASISSLLPNISRLELNYCVHWPLLPPLGKLPSLEFLEIKGALASLPEGLIRQATCLATLDLANVCALKSIRGFPSVKQLSISGISDLEIVTDLPALEFLKLDTFGRRNHHLPDWLAACPACFTTLQRLDVYGTTQLLRRCLQSRAYWPMIKHFPIFSIKDNRRNYINYIKHSCSFDTNLVDAYAAFAAAEEEEETEEEEEEDINDL
ncbi:hypothetical protein C4D60_Mb01t04200 [Musa balbisiana]|uniref:Disease resistance R13L4/SHOC-2-like LRR domain-containing protein n=1 Tax=Musa balbisiana TaxID=52838 RepID=A0A4S8JJR8_MUSBA|nr:hypothetical protein C4D60_Mb01t04200 [Musa balbisiana]